MKDPAMKDDYKQEFWKRLQEEFNVRFFLNFFLQLSLINNLRNHFPSFIKTFH